MNLADAIRQASQRTAQPTTPAPAPAATPQVAENPVPENVASAVPAQVAAAAGHPLDPHHLALAHSLHTTVRLELFLTPEQLKSLFGAIATAQHAVLTLREAAAHLRTTPHALEELAREGGIPALLIDGRWRFSRAALDEWLTLQRGDKETAA